MLTNHQTEVRQTVEIAGRTYDITATTTQNGRVRIEVVAVDADGQIISQLTGDIPLEDLSPITTVVSRLLTAASVLNLDEPLPGDTLESANHVLTRQYPNVGKRWESIDDELLVAQYNAGTSIRELAKVFGRKPGGIRSRLIKHGLIELPESNPTGESAQEVDPGAPTTGKSPEGHDPTSSTAIRYMPGGASVE
ncbi:hypothetical protein FB566_4980 [Stackebrandtia endophytica]|uniref:Uncharacterized protein n=2 Tax=Stackebrandtia endophytica TaxID=1496996 RepID=A0A543B3G8_9ACTN|nr:hypothetical protein FB566_4980 [Stackebrandtia endophytica]